MDEFFGIFRNDIRNKAILSEKHMLCEKAFLLWSTGNCFVVKHFMELLEDKSSREILEKDYEYSLKDFYTMNKNSLAFD